MNKSRFIELIRDPQRIQARDLEELRELSRENPYSQIIHILAAKGSHNLEADSFYSNLAKAATYSRDRLVLKRTIEGIEIPSTALPVIDEAEPPVEEANFDWLETDTDATPELPGEISQQEEPPWDLDSPESLTEESFEDDSLDEENQPEAKTPESTREDKSIPNDQPDLSNVSDAPLEAPEITGTVAEDFEATSAEDEIESANEDSDDLSEDLLDLEINAQAQAASIHDELQSSLNKLRQSREEYEQEPEDTSEEDSKPDHALETPESLASDEMDAVVEEVDETISDQELAEADLESSALSENDVTESESQEATPEELEQDPVEIIDTFIKNSPVLSKPDLSADSEATSQKDLSKKSGTFNDDLVSEQLAKIMLKQGRKKEAEKIYKKLIVKFPKKKSYFADQIKNLSKK